MLGALRSVGPSLLYSTGSLLLGVLVLLGSNFVPLQQFAALTALNVVISLLVDLLVLPAILVTARFVTLWDVLSLKLGGAPHDEIPLLRGLTRSQARVAVLMGVLKTVARGEKIARQGDPGDAMFVLVNGRARIERCSNDRVAMLEELHRGAVIGEMGLVRQRPRMADVIALEDSELLVVDQRFLANLQQRYPRIGAIVFLNLTRILSDRVEATARTTRRATFLIRSGFPTDVPPYFWTISITPPRS